MADSFELKAIITAVDQLSGPLKGMQRQLKGFQKELTGLAVGSAAVGTTLLGAFAGAAKEAMGLENHMADARKAIEELHDPKVFQQMTDQIVDMSTQLPMSAEGIAAIVAEAGNAGIPFKELTRFAEDATKAAVGFGMTAEEAGHQLAVWRNAFSMTQDEVMKLSDQLNYLSMIGPTTEKQIGEVVTRVGSFASTAGVAAKDVAAMAATITGMGVQSDVAATGIKNMIASLSNANTGSAKATLKAMGMTSESIAVGLQKDSRGTILKVLEGIKKLDKFKQPKALQWLFGMESQEAIAPMLAQLGLLQKNFAAVDDKTKYAGATQREFESRAKTTAAQLQILKNQLDAMVITVGSEFLPAIVQATKEIAPFAKQALTLIRNNPEMVKAVAKFALALVGVSAAMAGVSRAIKIMNFAFNMTPAKAVIGLLVWGAYEIIQNWDEVAPVIKQVWQEVDHVAQALGGWETIAGGVGLFMAGRFATQTVGTLTEAVTVARELSGLLQGMAALGTVAIQISVAIYMFKKLEEIADAVTEHDKTGSFWESLSGRWSAGGWANYAQQRASGVAAGIDPVQLPQARAGARLSSPVPYPLQKQELTVKFENAPPGTVVGDIPRTGNPLMTVKTDVGYSPFRNPQ